MHTFTWVLHEQKGWDKEGDTLDSYLVGVVVGYRNNLAGTGRANSCLCYTNVVRESYTHLVGASFLAVKLVWAHKWCLVAENADYCKFVNE